MSTTTASTAPMNAAQKAEASKNTANSIGQTQTQPQVRLVDVPVANENVSLNLMVGFLNLAQKRGVFSLDESAKIWECIKVFQKIQGPSGPESTN